MLAKLGRLFGFASKTGRGTFVCHYQTCLRRPLSQFFLLGVPFLIAASGTRRNMWYISLQNCLRDRTRTPLCSVCSVCHRVFANISQTCMHGLLLKLNCSDSCLFGFLFIRSYIIELMLPDDQDIISVADLFHQYFDCRQVRFV